jgi:hypothetical protein
MSEFKMIVELNDAAFCDDDGDFDPSYELSRILKRVSREVDAGVVDGKVYDVNGNKVGKWEILE